MVAFALGPAESVRDPPGTKVCEPGNTNAPAEFAVAVMFPTATVLEDESGVRVWLSTTIIERGGREIVAWDDVMADVTSGLDELERVMDLVAITDVEVIVLKMGGVKEFEDPKNTDEEEVAEEEWEEEEEEEEENEVVLGIEEVVWAAAAVGKAPVIVLEEVVTLSCT